VTCAPFTPDHLTSCLDEIVFEEFNFGALQRLPAPAGAGLLYHAESAAAAGQAAQAGAGTRETAGPSLASSGQFAALVVDLGYSCTYVVPMVRGSAIQSAVRRLNIGGRLMTALLQETVSFRQYNMMDEV
jgi:actin-related protein 6